MVWYLLLRTCRNWLYKKMSYVRLSSIFRKRISAGSLALCLCLAYCGVLQAQNNSVSLSIGGTANPNPVYPGDQFAYSLTVSNSGTNLANNVVVSAQLPASLNFVAAFPGQGTYSVDFTTVTFELGDLPSGGIATLQLYVVPQSAGDFTNTVSIWADEPNLNSANDTIYLPVTVSAPAPPVITKQPLGQLLNLGGLLNLVAEVVGSPGVHYQWRRNGANIPGATNSTYTVLSLLSSDCGIYTLVASDQYGVATSESALVSLLGLLSLSASDNFASRGPLSILGTTTGSNVGATSEPGEPLHAGVPGGKSVWFTWTPLLSGVATFSTAGSGFDTLLAVYTGNNLTNLTPVASDDDGAGYYCSRVTFNAVGGTAYQIAVDGAYGAEGNIVLTSSQQLLAAPVAQIVAQPADQVVAFGGAAQFTVQASGKRLSYQWSFNGQAVAGATSSSLQVANVSIAKVGLYSVAVKAFGSSSSILSKPASLQISVTDGGVNTNQEARAKYQALANSGATTMHYGTLGLRPVKSDASTARGFSNTQVFNTYGSQTQSGEPNNCNTPGGSSSWVSITANANGLMVINTYGSSFPTILGAYTGNGNDFSSLSVVACDVGTGTNGTSNGSISFAATSGTTYYISVDGVNGTYGKVVLNSTLNVMPSVESQPTSQAASPGSTISLTATVSGYPAPICQWWFNGAPLAGCTNCTLTVSAINPGKAGTYAMVATNTVGSVITIPAAVVLNSPMHLDSFGPNPTNNLFQMRVVGFANTNYTISASTDMVHWVPLATNSSPTGLWSFTDAQSPNFSRRFYRVSAGP